jgi:Mn2+/Fe2+ NRAMP family transporter
MEVSERMREEEIKEPPRGFLNILRNIGPGIVLSGAVIGSGELLVTTRIGAQFGYIFLWGVVLCCLVKYFVQIELGRFCISSNLTSVQAFNRFPIGKIGRTTILNLFFFAILVMITPGLAGIFGSCAGLVHSLVPAISAKLWGIILYASVVVVLWRGYYGDIEGLVVILVGGFSLAIIICFLLIQGTKYHVTGLQFLSGLTFKIPEGGTLVAMALMGSVGVTAVELFIYPYWLKEKGYGRYIGPKTETNRGEWARRQKGWMTVLKADALICTLIATVITIAYYLVAASILHYGLGTVPTGINVVKGLASMFTESYGRWSYGIFMFGAFCTLYSTLYVGAAASGRLWTDLFDSLKIIKLGSPGTRLKWHRFFQMFWPGLWLVFFLGIPKPMTTLIWGVRFNGLWLPFISLAVAYLSKDLFSDVRLSRGTSIALWATIGCILVYTMGYFVLSTGEPLFFRWGFSILTAVFTVYTIVACVKR